jgi:protein-arginine deiminase
VRVDTSWLEIGHVDEFTAFLPAPTRRGWKLVVADPRLAYRLLRSAARRGHGRATVLAGQRYVDIDPAIPARRPVVLRNAERSIRAVLADPALRAANRRAAQAIDANLRTLHRELGLRATEVVRLPVLFETLQASVRGGVAAWLPNAVNGVYLQRGMFVVPCQHGPLVGGRISSLRRSGARFARLGSACASPRRELVAGLAAASSASRLDLAPEGVDAGVPFVRDLLERLMGLVHHDLEPSAGDCVGHGSTDAWR